MSRESLPSMQADTGGLPFFPSFQREMNRLLDQFRAGFPIPDTSEHPVFGTPLFPAIDVVEHDDAIEISAEVPGIREEDLDAYIFGEMLTLKGEKNSEHEEKQDGYHRLERRYGSFKRQVPLGFKPEDDAVETKFSDGVLKLTIAKPATAKADIQKIDISKN